MRVKIEIKNDLLDINNYYHIMGLFWSILKPFKGNDNLVHEVNYEGTWISNMYPGINGKIYAYLPENLFNQSQNDTSDNTFSAEILVHYDPTSPYKPDWRVRFPVKGIDDTTLGGGTVNDSIGFQCGMKLATMDQNIIYAVDSLENINDINGKYYSMSPNDKGKFNIKSI